jgi:hypothetical protein
MTAGRRTLVVLVLAATLFLATFTITQATAQAEDACPTPKYAVMKPSGAGRRVSTDSKKIKLKFGIKNTSPTTLDNYVIRMGIPADKITYESYNVMGHTAKKKATALFATEPNGTAIAWTLFNVPAGGTFRFLVFVKVRDCAAIGPLSFPISSYFEVEGVPLCPVDGPAPRLRIVMPRKSSENAASGCPP